MFKLECLIDDKKLALALRALDGMIFEPKVVPVTNAVIKRGKVSEAQPGNGNGNVVHRVHELLRAAGAERSTVTDIKRACGEAGMSPDSYSYAVRKLMEAKLLRRSGSAGSYKYRVIGGDK